MEPLGRRPIPAWLRRLRRLHDDERGVIAVVASFVLLSMIGVLALTIDLGYAYGLRRMAQNVADSAAVAGTKVVAQDVQLPGSQTDIGVLAAIRDVARKSSGGFLERNGAGGWTDRFVAQYVNGSLSLLGTVGQMAGGQIPNGAKGVKVMPARTIGTFFASALGVTSLAVGARATARTDAVTGLAPGFFGPYVIWAGESRYLCKDASGNPISSPDPNGNPSYAYGCGLVDLQNPQQFSYRCNNYANCNVSNKNPRWNYHSSDFKGYLHIASGFMSVGGDMSTDVQTGNAIGTAEPLAELSSCYARRAQGCTVAMPVIDWSYNAGSAGIGLRIVDFVAVRLDMDPSTAPPSTPWTGTPVPGSLLYGGPNVLTAGTPPVAGMPALQYVRLVG